MVFNGSFKIKIDSIFCEPPASKGAYLDKESVYDTWEYSNQQFESGKIYGLIGEYGQGCMYLSYLLGGKIDLGDLKVYCNEIEISKEILELNSWNLEPAKEYYKNAIVKKSIEKALNKNFPEDSFSNIADKFILTQPRFDRKLIQLSGERWRASAALGYAEGKKIFYAPYKTSIFYYQMCQSGLLKVLRELTNSGAVVILPAGTDDFIKHIADKCIYVNHTYNIDILREQYRELFNNYDWIH